MHEQRVPYDCDGVESEGFVVRPDGTGPFPVVVVGHTIMGLSDGTRAKGRALAELGYAVFCWDLYGAGNRPADKAAARPLMNALLADRGGTMARRMSSSVALARGLEDTDGDRVAAIGYCFGGLCVLDLARMGAEIRGVVALHGILGAHPFEHVGRRPKVLALHGYDDPLATPDAMREFCDEMTGLGVDWQLHAYGGTVHAFTTPDANDRAGGIAYDADADRRSWAALTGFLEEVLT